MTEYNSEFLPFEPPEQENVRLREENARLRRLLAVHSIPIPQFPAESPSPTKTVDPAPVDKEERARKRIALFRSLFRGREDGYLVASGIKEICQITPADISGFVESRPRHSSRSYNGLIGTLRGLFDWMVVHEMLHESPLRCESRRITPARRPFLFDVDQARRLLDAAAQLPSNPRALARGEFYRMIFAILYGLGLRVGEVSRLCRKDIDFEARVLIIRQTKFGKDRLVPFGPKMASEIAAFVQREESRFGPIMPDSPVFSFGKQNRKAIGTGAISWTFHKLMPALQLVVPAGVAPPHLHCLRHSFAVGTLLRWYREGVDPMTRLFDLSTFLGHVSPSSTAVYLTITTELLECASSRFANFAANSRKESVR